MADPPAVHRIAVFTGSRAEYGLLRHLIAAIAAEPGLDLQLIVSGSHLSDRHGSTLAEIEADGHRPAALVPLSLDQTLQPSMAALAGEALMGIGAALERLQPELLFVLGDRYEAFAAAAAAHLLTIKVVHLHGGETSAGAVDDRLRHAISQLSSWHFTASEPYRQRVIAMGHPPHCVFNVGPMALDGFAQVAPISRKVLEQSTGYRFGPLNLLVTYHPETLRSDHGLEGFESLLGALASCSCHVLFTYPNADAGADALIPLLQEFVGLHPTRCWAVPSLGQQLYLPALNLFDAMAGNSSSGLIEAPLLNMPVLNIGDRQAGRLRHDCVIDVCPNAQSVKAGLEQVLRLARRGRPSATGREARKTPVSVIVAWLRGQNWR